MQAGLFPESIALEQKLLPVPTGPLCISKSESGPSIELSIVLPTLNEARNLERLVPLVDGILRELQVSYELIVVDDGIAAVLRVLAPHVKIYAAEIETAAPLAASLAAGEPVTVNYAPSFVDGKLHGEKCWA